MEKISIRRVTDTDAALLVNIAPAVFNDPIDDEYLGAYLAYPAAMLVVAMDGDLVVGQLKAAVHRHPDKPSDLYVDELAVAASYRRQGIARALLDELERWARERGCADVWLAADPDNHFARSLYASFAQSKPSILYYWDL